MPGLKLPMLCSEFINKDIKLGEKTKTAIVVTKSRLVDGQWHVYQTHTALNIMSLSYYYYTNTAPRTTIHPIRVFTHKLPGYFIPQAENSILLAELCKLKGRKKNDFSLSIKFSKLGVKFLEISSMFVKMYEIVLFLAW